MKDLLLVSSGIRLSCLIDYKIPSNLESILTRLKKFPLIQKTKIVQIDDFVFLMNPSTFRACLVKRHQPVYINISSGCGIPKLCTQDQVEFIDNKIKTICDLVNSNLENPLITLKPDLGAFILTLAGSFLEYPFIYFQDPKQDPALGNCLSNVPLTIFQPMVQLGKETALIWNQIDDKRDTSQSYFSILSCSVPTTLLEDLHPNSHQDQSLLVNHLFGVFIERLLMTHDYWAFSSLKIEQVVLQHVLL